MNEPNEPSGSPRRRWRVAFESDDLGALAAQIERAADERPDVDVYVELIDERAAEVPAWQWHSVRASLLEDDAAPRACLRDEPPPADRETVTQRASEDGGYRAAAEEALDHLEGGNYGAALRVLRSAPHSALR